ncbi:MAG: hypothetical protein FJ130_00425 [Deltaproteobacteria bacterium]|nr:hypothetical protein [Deltaproteobacteria bacterium]
MSELILKEELEYFNSMLDQWLQVYEGKFALIKDHKLVDTFTTFEEAYKKTVELFGNSPVLIKKITKVDQPERIPALTLGLIRAYL